VTAGNETFQDSLLGDDGNESPATEKNGCGCYGKEPICSAPILHAPETVGFGDIGQFAAELAPVEDAMFELPTMPP